MKGRYIAVYLETSQVLALLYDAQETVLAADEDLEITEKISNIAARRIAREEIDKNRDLYVEIVGKLQEASERLNVGEGDYIDELAHSPMSATIEEATRHPEKQGGTG